jgi:tRNA A-37 threonylcarbamoyl transferase component Bud32
MTPTAGSIVGKRFELVRELGRGSMGTVWLAEHLALEVRCAVKFMSNEALRDPSFAARFELEARTIAQLKSPNVVRVLDHDSHEGTPFIAMECLQGEDLGVRIRRLGRIDAAATYRIVAQVANGLAKAHAAGIVHRDLKPENIFLAQDDDGGEIAKLLDFGVAKVTGRASWDGAVSSTQAGAVLGTPAYMAPEQARGSELVDHRADLWSLAVVAYECLTGRLPFDGPTIADVFAKILSDSLPVPSEVDPVCTAEFDRFWLKAAARNPDYRFPNAPELAQGLGRALGILETPPSIRDTLRARGCEAPLPARPRPRRARLLAGALVLAVAPLVATLASGGIEARSSRDAGATRVEIAFASSIPDPIPLATPGPLAVVDPGAARAAASAPPTAPALAAAGESKAARSWHATARAASPRSKPAATRPTSTEQVSPIDDIDFGI